MNPTLAALYNTNGYGDAVRQQQVKVAHLELFAKAAAAQNIDLSELDDSTRNALYAEFTQQKLAEDGESPSEEESSDMSEEGESEEGESEGEGPEEEKKEAQAQYRKMRQFQEKVAEADYIGRVMAHAFNDEDRNIKLAGGAIPMPAIGATYKALPPHVSAVGKAGKAVSGAGKKVYEGAGNAASAVGGAASGAGKKVYDAAGGAGSAAGRHIMANKGRYAAGAAAAGTLAGGALLARHLMKKKPQAQEETPKEASAFDVQSARQAVKIASAAGWDDQEAVQRLEALLVLGVPEMSKTAAALEGYGQAINVRALELLESSGYPVDWTQVFGE